MKNRSILAAVLVVVGIGACMCFMRPDPEVSGHAESVSAAIPAVAAHKAAVVPSAVPPLVSTNQTVTSRGTLPFVVKSETPIDKPVRLALEAMGARTVGVRSRTSLLVELDAAAYAKIAADGRFTTEEFVPSQKVSPELADLLASGAKTVDVSILSLAAADRELVRGVVATGGGEVLKGCLEGASSFKARLSAALVNELVDRGDVRWLERFERPHLMNDIAGDPIAMNVWSVWQSAQNPGGLSGTNQVVTTSDSGIDNGKLGELHGDLNDRVIGIKVVEGCDGSDMLGHGTHTAGSIVGNGSNSCHRIRGTAWGAKLFAWFCGVDGGTGIKTPSSIEDLLQPDPESFTSHVHSASWGSNSRGRYTDECQTFDDYLWEHPDYLPVVSAGNSGSGVRTIGSPAAAKNVLAVGATQNLRIEPYQYQANGDPRRTAGYSSRGPCADGRIKPDIAAPGTGVLSTRSRDPKAKYSYGVYDDNYAYDTGTSMACPLTAGAVALVREWLVRRDEFSDDDETKWPSAALMKAVITGGAKDAATPNNNQGWGRVDLAETLYPSNRAVKLVDKIPFAAGKKFTYVVETTNAAPLDVQLVWVDAPGDPAKAGAQLVNDLDLVVRASHGGTNEVWYGNGGSEPDTLNNVESVRVAAAEPTKYVITVDCKTIVYDSTDGGAAALYVRGAFDPEATPTEPKPVKILREPVAEFGSFEEAVENVQDGETIAIVAPTGASNPIEFSKNCTIKASGADPSAFAVDVNNGATLTVRAGARLCLKDVSFVNEAAFTVEAGGVLALAGAVVAGPVTTEDANGIELAGVLSKRIDVHAPNAGFGETFGVCSDESAAESAKFIFNADDPELFGSVEGGKLVWRAATVLDSDVVVKLGTRRFRSMRMLANYLKEDATITVMKTCALTEQIMVTNNLVLIGDILEAPYMIPEGNGGFYVAGGRLAVSNLTFFGGTTSDALFLVGDSAKGGKSGELILGSGTSVKDLIGTHYYHGGAVCLKRGRAVLGENSFITGCKAAGGKACGGGVYAEGADSTVVLEGGCVSECSATSDGGGIYLYNEAQLTVSGWSRVYDNMLVDGNGEWRQWSDIVLWNPLEVVGPVTSPKGSIGVSGDYSCVAEGDSFASYKSADLSEEQLALTAAAFYNTEDGSLGAVTNVDKLVWVTEPPSLETDEAHAHVRVIYPDATTNYYATLARAAVCIVTNCTVEIMGASNNMSECEAVFRHEVTLTSEPSRATPAVLGRMDNSSLTVARGATLVITNLSVAGLQYVSGGLKPNEDIEGGLAYAYLKLIDVRGGSLVLADGAEVYGFQGASVRDASAIVVEQGGRLTMLDGASVHDCCNYKYDSLSGANSGAGGGILVDRQSTACLLGGEVRNCSAVYGGGICVCNESTAYVAGGFSVTNNTSKLTHAASNLLVEDKSKLYLLAPLSDAAEIGRLIGERADMNLVAYVDDWTSGWTAAELRADAAKFVSDDYAGVSGVAVTNESETALIVWSTAVDADGCYRPEEGPAYYAIGSNPAPHSTPPEPEYAMPGPVAFTEITHATDSVTLVFTGAVQWCNYRLFATDSLAEGFAVTTPTGGLLLQPVTNFQWKSSDTSIELTFPTNITRRFWKVTAEQGEINPAE